MEVGDKVELLHDLPNSEAPAALAGQQGIIKSVIGDEVVVQLNPQQNNVVIGANINDLKAI